MHLRRTLSIHFYNSKNVQIILGPTVEPGYLMVLLLDGNSEIGAHGPSDFVYLIFLTYLRREKESSHNSFARVHRVLSYHLI